MSIVLGQMRQVGYVVKDIEMAMKKWTEIGAGPWYYVEKAPVENFRYKGEPSDMEMSVAITNSGYTQIELIQQLNDAPSLYRDFIQSGKEGAHHIAYWMDTEKFNVQTGRFLENGYSIGHSGEIGANGRFVYFVNEKFPGTIIEISEMSGIKGEFFKAIAESCENWDGSDPVRR